MVIQLCGRFVVQIGGRRREDDLPGRQGRLLLAYLAVNAFRSASRDELIEAVWSEDPPASPDAGLSALLSKLRRALGAGAVQGLGDIRLSPPPGSRIDVHRAAEAIHLAESAIAAGDPDRGYGPSQVALHISERGFLPGCEAPWIEAERRRLEDVRLRALECTAAWGLTGKNDGPPTAERAARMLIELAPFRESGYRALMQALERQGNFAEALRVYDRVRCLLRDELGTAPAPPLQELHERLLKQSPAG
jgi:DNA-binding SARP family transcriptional activator